MPKHGLYLNNVCELHSGSNPFLSFTISKLKSMLKNLWDMDQKRKYKIEIYEAERVI